MASADFGVVYGRTMELFGEQRYAEAEEFLVAEGAAFPDFEAETYYLRSCAAARLEDADRAIALIREALDRGHWYGEATLRQSPSWQSLQGLPAFEEVAAESIEREKANHVPACYLTALPDSGAAPPYRALITLHGNGATAEKTLEAWRPAVGQGRLVAAIQSSQQHAGGFMWVDEELGHEEVQQQYGALAAEHALDIDHLVIAGFSMGAEQALRSALDGSVPARGFILMGPGGPYTEKPERWLPLIEARQATGIPLRGYVLLGELDDEVPVETHRRFTELLVEHGIECGFELVPDVAHDYPADFGPYIERALAFVDPRV